MNLLPKGPWCCEIGQAQGVTVCTICDSAERDLAAANEKGENLHAKYRETEAALIAARRELAEARDGARVVWEVVNKVSSILFATEQEADSYIGQFSISIGLTKIRRDVFKSPAQGATSTAPQIAHSDHPLRHWDRTCPACLDDSAVPDDPVAWMAANHNLMFITKPQQTALRALARHYEARGRMLAELERKP